MPGRRFPPQSPEARGAQHRRAAFEGALDGMSYLPSPIKQNPPGTVHGRYLMQFGQDEKVVTSWGRQEVPLSNKATPYSEHVFVCGPLYGRALREGVEWERYSDFQGVAVLDTAGVQPGEVIVVEYARFGGGSAISDVCTQTYPSIVTPEASALTYLSQPGTYLPPPDGFPTRLVNEDYDDPGTWFAAWFVSYGGISGTQLATTAVPGIAPGSAYARETRRTTTGRIPGVAHDIILYSGDLRPRWSQATRVGGESWFRQDLALPTEFESDFIQYIYWYADSGRYRVWTSVGYNNTAKNWYVEMNRTAHPVEGGGTLFRHALTGWTGIPHDGDVHRMGYDIDCASRTITAFFDSQKFTYTGPEVWPSGEALAWEVYAEEERSDWVGYSFESAIGANTAKALITDGHTIRTDVPYCKWETEPGPLIWMDSPRQTTTQVPKYYAKLTTGRVEETNLEYGSLGAYKYNFVPSGTKVVWDDPATSVYQTSSDFPLNGAAHIFRAIGNASDSRDAVDVRELYYNYTTFYPSEAVAPVYEPWDEYYSAPYQTGWVYKLPDGSTYEVRPDDEDFDQGAYDSWIANAAQFSTFVSAQLVIAGKTGGGMVGLGTNYKPNYELCYFADTVPVPGNAFARVPPSIGPGAATDILTTVDTGAGFIVTYNKSVDVTSYMSLPSFCVGGHFNWQRTREYYTNANITATPNRFMQAYLTINTQMSLTLQYSYDSPVKWALLPRKK